MDIQINVKEYITDALQINSLAVLATAGEGQPHACYIANPISWFVELTI